MRVTASFTSRAAGFRGFFCGAHGTECAHIGQPACTRVCTCAPARVRTLGLGAQGPADVLAYPRVRVRRAPALGVRRGANQSTLRCGGAGLPSALHPQ